MIRMLFRDFRFTRSYKGNHPLGSTLRTLSSPSFLCMFSFRLSSLFLKIKFTAFAKLFWWINYLFFKVDIDYRATLEGGVYMPHPMGIVIGSGVIINEDIKIMQGVCVGGNLGRTLQVNNRVIMQPQILGGGFLGVNSIISGPIILEKKIFVAANSIVSKSFNESLLLFGVNCSKELNEEHRNEMH